MLRLDRHALRPTSTTTQHPSNVLRVATYNIHKGVRGVGPRKRLEIHNLVLGIEALDADFVFLQEVRRMNRAAARHFPDTRFGWPKVPQADYLAPDGYEVAYRTNAVTRDGEHGNALLSRWPIGDIGHHDVSDHRFEQRGLLHVPVTWNGTLVHAIVAHFGLIHSSRVRQVAAPRRVHRARGARPTSRCIVAGDFNDWGDKLDLPMTDCGLVARDRPRRPADALQHLPVAPAAVLDGPHLHARLSLPRRRSVPRGAAWARMSDHLPLVAELELA